MDIRFLFNFYSSCVQALPTSPSSSGRPTNVLAHSPDTETPFGDSHSYPTSASLPVQMTGKFLFCLSGSPADPTFSEIRVWTLGGDVVYTLSGHTSFVYSLSVLPNGDIVSAGEDRSVRVWKDGECSQVITHPAISVWTVSSMPNGDIVSGSSDGVVRIFTASEERYASQADLKEYDDLVASQALPTQQVGDVKKSDLPGLEALSTPGDAPGKVKMVRNGEMVEAHQVRCLYLGMFLKC